jgi:hypothetical protein
MARTLSTIVVAPEKPITRKLRSYFFRVIQWVENKRGTIATLSRPGVCEWLADTCKFNNIDVMVYRWGQMPYLPHHNCIEVNVINDQPDFEAIKDVVQGHSLVIGVFDGEDTWPITATSYANMLGKITRTVDYHNPTSD